MALHRQVPLVQVTHKQKHRSVPHAAACTQDRALQSSPAFSGSCLFRASPVRHRLVQGTHGIRATRAAYAAGARALTRMEQQPTGKQQKNAREHTTYQQGCRPHRQSDKSVSTADTMGVQTLLKTHTVGPCMQQEHSCNSSRIAGQHAPLASHLVGKEGAVLQVPDTTELLPLAARSAIST